MTNCCDGTDFTYPLLADIYYPIVEQSAYGNTLKTWIFDSSIPCSFSPLSSKVKQDVVPNTSITIDNLLYGRAKRDITQSLNGTNNAVTNIIITNIRDTSGNIIYNESSGPRVGLATLFEIATNNAIVGPFGSTEYYKIILRRSENQAVIV